MLPSSPARSWQVVDQYVAAFEAARAGRGQADPSAFLPPRESPQYLAVLAELVRVDLELGWQEGANPPLDSYRASFPELFDDPDLLREAAYEEYRLRIQAGQQPSPAEYERRFGVDTSTWEGPLREIEFPALGSNWGEFRLLRELGRGTFARVYLAQQGGLADRLVALKLSRRLPLESQTLAQLQHSNIVPIYSAHAEGPWQGLCMPYFGATTLADVVGRLRGRKSLPLRGRELVDTVVARRSATLPLPRPPRDSDALPSRVAKEDDSPAPALDAQLFDPWQRLSYIEAVLWIAVRAAEGLAHAHARGIVHQDLKPANILLADDGRPMLLDFNLSTDAKRTVDAREALVGGTLPYMAPEQLVALRSGQPAATPQADLYALGCVLFELVTGRRPFPTPTSGDDLEAEIAARQGPLPQLRLHNAAVTPAVESIVHKCLAPEACGRYATADDLREDLERQLAHRPLKHAPNTSLIERTGKWARRQGKVGAALALAAVAALVVLVLGSALAARHRHAQRLEAVAAAAQAHGDAQAIAFLFSQPDAESSERLEAERKAQALADRFSLLDSAGPAASPTFLRLSDDDRRRLAGDLATAVEFWKFDLDQRLARSPRDARRAEWSQTLARLKESTRSLSALSGRESASLDAARGAIVAGDLETAVARLTTLTNQNPADFSAWALLGHCQMFLGRYREADASFSVCRALWPESAWPSYYRGQSRYRAREFAGALTDFNAALALRPEWSEAHYQRALAHLALRQPAAALQDLDAAQGRGDLPPLRVHCLRARVHQALGKRLEATNDLNAALAIEASDDKIGLVSRGIARLQMRRDAPGALADFDAALNLDPEYRAALENKAHVLSEQLDRPQEAIEVLNRAVTLYPSYVAAVAGRGVLLARQGDRNKALADAEKALQLERSPMTLYQVAGIYALTSRQEPQDRQSALELLRSALEQGYGYDLLERDHDLDPLRELESFQQLAQAARAVQKPRGHSGP